MNTRRTAIFWLGAGLLLAVALTWGLGPAWGAGLGTAAGAIGAGWGLGIRSLRFVATGLAVGLLALALQWWLAVALGAAYPRWAELPDLIRVGLVVAVLGGLTSWDLIRLSASSEGGPSAQP